MKVHYDNEIDALYIKLGNQKPEGVTEISEGVNLDTTAENSIVGIEILNASKKMNTYLERALRHKEILKA